MSASLRSPKPAGAREPVSGSGQVAVSERRPIAYRRRGRRDLNAPSEPGERAALRGGLEQSGGRATAPESGVAAHVRHSCPAPGGLCGPEERVGRPLLVIRPEWLSAGWGGAVVAPGSARFSARGSSWASTGCGWPGGGVCAGTGGGGLLGEGRQG